MYKGFNLAISASSADPSYYVIGKTLAADSKEKSGSTLKTILHTGEKINGSKMQEDWFPQINADVFISHSHQDEDLAIAFAGWLYEHFKIKSFIDSSVWGHSDDLLRTLDNLYCKRDDGYYSYEKRNISTSHVHMMLSTALNQMIDKCECLFFLNTENSISIVDSIGKTQSAWIYSEITMSKLIRRRELSDYRVGGTRMYSESLTKAMGNIEYELDTDHLTPINRSGLEKWKSGYTNEKYPLDVLYRQHKTSKTIIG